MEAPVDLYIRVSRVGGREHLQSPADQEREARSFATSRGLTVGEVLTDLDKSGGTIDRPALKQALRRIEEGKSRGIVVAYLSRASRDTRQGLDLLDAITRAGGAVYAPNLPENYGTADGRMTTTIQLAIDAGYRERKTEELERAKRGAIENGIPIHSRPPVGYRTRNDRRLEPDPKTAPVLTELFDRRAQGEGPAALGRFLESRGVKTSQGSSTWSKQAVYGLIRNRVYLGELRYGKDGRFVNERAHEPIVDLATWQAAQQPNGARLAPARSSASEFLLTGLLRCAGCGYSLQATTSSRGKRIYRCTKTHAGGVCPEPVRAYAEPTEEAAVAAFWTVTNDLRAKGQQDTSGELTQLENALKKTERRLEQWSSPDVQDAIGDLAEYAKGLRERRDARDRAAAELGEARAKRNVRAILPIKTLQREWELATPQERREMLALRFDCLALVRDLGGELRLVVFPAGTGPSNLPRRGYNRDAVLRPFDDRPHGARVFLLEPAA